MSTPSALVADRYRLVKMLGAGGMGIVWQAWDTRLRREVALKMLRTQLELTDDERQAAIDRAMREARITAGLHHPHAVTVFDVVEHEGQPCIVMQLVESTPLSDLLREHGTFTPSETARIGAQVASALDAAHALKIVHRDVKPGNILIAGDGSARISDFGISHALGDTTITATGMIHGTPAYLAPEVARGLPTSFASDVFSLGSTLYAMVEGEPPFGTDRNPIALLHRVARGGYPPPKHAGPLVPILRKMLASHPKRRPSMAAVVEALTSLEEGETADSVVSAGLVALGFDAATVGAPAHPEGEAVGPEAQTPRTIALDQVADEAVEAAPAAAPTDAPAQTAATEKLPASDTPVAEPRRDEAPVAGTATGKTIPVDQPTRYQPPTAETERLRPAAPAGAAAVGAAARDVGRAPSWTAAPPPAGPPPAGPPRPERRRRAALITGILALLVVVGAGIALFLSPLGSDLRQAADPTPEQTSETNSVSETPEPEPVAPAPSASAPPEEQGPAPTEEQEPSAPPVTPEQRVVDTISGYYTMLPEDRDSAWPLMTADYQENHAGGRGGYDAFWSEIADVTIADVTATGPDTGQATLTYYFRDGRVAEEVTAYRFVDEGGVLKIAATEVLSSR